MDDLIKEALEAASYDASNDENGGLSNLIRRLAEALRTAKREAWCEGVAHAIERKCRFDDGGCPENPYA